MSYWKGCLLHYFLVCLASSLRSMPALHASLKRIKWTKYQDDTRKTYEHLFLLGYKPFAFKAFIFCLWPVMHLIKYLYFYIIFIQRSQCKLLLGVHLPCIWVFHVSAQILSSEESFYYAFYVPIVHSW